MTVHDDIDNLLAADLHGELPEAERNELHAHLVECAACRQAYQESKLMNKMLEETLATEKPDARFEQRMLSGFRNRVPGKSGGLASLLGNLLRLRSARIAAVAATLLVLVQVGRMVTHPAAQEERVLVTGSNIPTAEEVSPEPPSPLDSLNAQLAKNGQKLSAGSPQAAVGGFAANQKSKVVAQFRQEGTPGTPPPPMSMSALESRQKPSESTGSASIETPVPAAEANRKLIRNARIDLEIVSFEDAVQKISQFANEGHGYIATSSSQKQANGKLKGEIVAKVLPQNLDGFLQKVRGLGELKDQTIGTEDVTKHYFDTDARLKNARVMEQRLIDMLKTKTGKVTDLLQVEKELGRVREEIEKMQGELKYWDSQVQLATVTISLAEKDMEEPAAFLLQEHAQLSLFVPDVEKAYNEIRSLASAKVQITDARLERDNSGRVVAHVGMLIVPDESGQVIGEVKEKGRIDNFQDQTSRVAQGGNGLSENAKTKRDKVDFDITITREADEQPVQETSLRILTKDVDRNAAHLKEEAAKLGAEIRNSTFSRDPDGREVANISLRLPMKSYAATMESLKQLGEVKDVQVERRDKMGTNVSEENAPADVTIQMYSPGNIVPSNTGLFATLRHTLAQGVGALMWSLRMIGVAIAFLAPWAAALVALTWIAKRVIRARK